MVPQKWFLFASYKMLLCPFIKSKWKVWLWPHIWGHCWVLPEHFNGIFGWLIWVFTGYFVGFVVIRLICKENRTSSNLYQLSCLPLQVNTLGHFKNTPLIEIQISERKITAFQFWNYRQRNYLFVYNPCKNCPGRTTSNSGVVRKTVIPNKHEFALQGAIFRVNFRQVIF